MSQKKCIECGKEFEAKRADATLCSDRCRQTHCRRTTNKTGNVTDAGELVREAIADGPRCSQAGCLCKAATENLCQRHYDELLKERELERRKKPTSA